MCLIMSGGLRYGSFNGFEYVYGIPTSQALEEEVINTFPNGSDVCSKIEVYRDSMIGTFYIIPNSANEELSDEVVKHIRSEYYSQSFEWLEFDNIRGFMKFRNAMNKSANIKLFISKSESKYYVRRVGLDMDNVTEFADCVDAETALILEHSNELLEVK